MTCTSIGVLCYFLLNWKGTAGYVVVILLRCSVNQYEVWYWFDATVLHSETDAFVRSYASLKETSGFLRGMYSLLSSYGGKK